MEREKVLVLFSGGKDSLLTTCMLIEKGFKVCLVNYDNSCTLKSDNVLYSVNKLIEKYGNERVEFIGIKTIIGIIRNFFLPIKNMKPSDIVNEYGELPYSQYNCLICRSSMYLYSIILCKMLDIKYMAEGARKSQSFVIELEPMLQKFRELLKEYDIELYTPVFDIVDDKEVDQELSLYNFYHGGLEPQCLLGVPINNKYPIDEEVIKATIKFYEKEIQPNAFDIIEGCTKKIKHQYKPGNIDKII